MNNSYTLWIVPPSEIKKVLGGIIRDLSEKYKTPYFEPHMTLVGNISCTREDVIKKTKMLCKDVKPFEISLEEVSFSTTYFQSVLVKIKPSASLMELNLKAKEIFKLDNNLFMPHISLMYGSHNMKLREKIAFEVKLPANLSFRANKIIVVPFTNNPESWTHLTEVDFC